MERNGEGYIHGPISVQEPVLCSSLFLDHVGEVILYLNPDGLSWKLLESSDRVSPSAPVLRNGVMFSTIFLSTTTSGPRSVNDFSHCSP